MGSTVHLCSLGPAPASRSRKLSRSTFWRPADGSLSRGVGAILDSWLCRRPKEAYAAKKGQESSRISESQVHSNPNFWDSHSLDEWGGIGRAGRKSSRSRVHLTTQRFQYRGFNSFLYERLNPDLCSSYDTPVIQSFDSSNRSPCSSLQLAVFGAYPRHLDGYSIYSISIAP